MCPVIRVSRSGYYARRGRPESVRSRFRRDLLSEIRRVHERFDKRYGAVKCWRHLKREGIACGRDQVVKLRRLNDIFSKRRRRFVVTTRSKPTYRAAPDRLNRVFSAAAPKPVWVGDVTFIDTRQGWLYLAVLLDLYSPRSWAGRWPTAMISPWSKPVWSGQLLTDVPRPDSSIIRAVERPGQHRLIVRR